MFWDKLIELCNNNDISPSKLCETLNFSNATATKWKNGATPHDSTLKKIADFFNVSIDYLAGREETKTEPTILTYSGNERVDSIVKEILKTNLTEDDLQLIEFVLNKYKK